MIILGKWWRDSLRGLERGSVGRGRERKREKKGELRVLSMMTIPYAIMPKQKERAISLS